MWLCSIKLISQQKLEKSVLNLVGKMQEQKSSLHKDNTAEIIKLEWTIPADVHHLP